MSESRRSHEASSEPTTVVVVGNGMVGHYFCEQLHGHDDRRQFKIVTFGDEPRPAYDRVALSSYFEHQDAERLLLGNNDWYESRSIDLFVGERVAAIDRQRRIVTSERGREIGYDFLVLATGSLPFVPPIDGCDKKGVFVYRTLCDLEAIADYAKSAKTATILGGGLLGLEAAKVARDLGLDTQVVELMPRLMPRQIDDSGSRLLVRRIEGLGVRVRLGTSAAEILGNGRVEGLALGNEETVGTDMVIIAAGIRPRDELARSAGLEVGPRGGVVVDDCLRTSDPRVFAIGEVALHRGIVYGLVAPGYEMARVVSSQLAGEDDRFLGGDLSAKLKLLGVDVANFGLHDSETDTLSSCDHEVVSYEDPFAGVYRKLVFSADGQKLLGGVLVGDASDYMTLASLSKSQQPLEIEPSQLVRGSSSAEPVAQPACTLVAGSCVCLCKNVAVDAIRSAVQERELSTVGEIQKATQAGSGCGGCLPIVGQILGEELERAGRTVTPHLCEHFAYSRQELFQIVKITGYRTFEALLESHGQGHGCEVCKPAVASILASLWNEAVLDHATLQDTNDRFLANIQRGGLYSIVPRVPGGEITPEKLIVLGTVAKKYGLYTKITGGQRVDLFGAQLHQLPDIWEELIAAGFESGHAYGKALRTVKSCVGSTWCRFGVGDSVGFAIRVENRYRGLRAPHKIKSAVSGCIRECAEAQSKDFGLIATEKGYDLYVCGNGGARPRHADLLASGLDEDTAIQYIDRFLMYYIQTADKLTRISVWLEKLEGGIEALRRVVVNDHLGIAEELERQMQAFVDSYRCEWREVVENPARRRQFRQFTNSDETELDIELIDERGHQRPADWPATLVQLGTAKARPSSVQDDNGHGFIDRVFAGRVDDFPENGGACIRHGQSQIAVFRFSSRGQWYAAQNMCPHKRAFVLSRGILGDKSGEPKVACPLHKKTYSLETGECLQGGESAIAIFPVEVSDNEVYVWLPPVQELDQRLATESCRITASCDRLLAAESLPEPSPGLAPAHSV